MEMGYGKDFLEKKPPRLDISYGKKWKEVIVQPAPMPTVSPARPTIPPTRMLHRQSIKRISLNQFVNHESIRMLHRQIESKGKRGLVQGVSSSPLISTASSFTI